MKVQSQPKVCCSHIHMNQSDDEFAKGEVHNNAGKSFNVILERTKNWAFHWLSKKHMKQGRIPISIYILPHRTAFESSWKAAHRLLLQAFSP